MLVCCREFVQAATSASDAAGAAAAGAAPHVGHATLAEDVQSGALVADDGVDAVLKKE